jgi:hypothetical protein
MSETALPAKLGRSAGRSNMYQNVTPLYPNKSCVRNMFLSGATPFRASCANTMLVEARNADQVNGR